MLIVGVFSRYFGISTLVHLLISYATLIAYYAILEGVWRASIGKRLVGLRVVLAPGGRAAGVSRAAGRTLIFETPNFVLLAIMFVVGEARWSSSRRNHL